MNNPQFSIVSDIQLVNLEELIGMKLKALLDRGSVRDLYDIYYLITKFNHLDLKKIKKSYIFYFVLACSQQYLSNFSKIDQIQNRNIIGGLYPFIPKNSHPNLEQMKDCVLSFAYDLLKYDRDELYFIEQFYQANFMPEYLFSNPDTLARAEQNPIANWKTKIKQNKR